MSDDRKDRRVSRRSFIAGTATGAVAGAAGTALGQEFVSLGNLDDLPPNWWEIDLPPGDPVDPVDPVDPGPIACCEPIPGGGADDPFGQTPGIAVRRNVFSLAQNGSEMSALRRGIDVMRARADTDPTSWNYQARIHGIVRGGGQPPFGAPWGTCRHVSDDFLPWHRLYLHFFERILREASGDPEFALPYWDYSVAGQNSLPPAFRQQFGNPLFEARRNTGINAGNPINPLVASSTTAMQTTRFSRPFFSAALENQPHNVIHVEIGGAMADPATAGEDPIFWLHHANIDRLWGRWIASGNGRANPVTNAFLNTPFSFADETGRFVTARGADALDPQSQLGYRYDDDPAAPVGIDPGAAFMVAAAPAPVMARSVAPAPPAFSEAAPEAAFAFELAETTLAEGDGLRLSGRSGKARLRPDPVPAPSIMMAPPPPRLGASESTTIEPLIMTPPPQEAFRTGAADEQPVLLQLENIDFDTPPGLWYAIYVNKPDAVDADPRGPYFAGIFAPFAQNMSDEPTTFDISGLLNRQMDAGLFDGGEIDVDFVPSRDDPDVPAIDIGRIRIVRP